MSFWTLKRVNWLIVVSLFLMITLFVLYLIDKGYRSDAERREAYLVPFQLSISEDGVEEGDSLDEVLENGPYDGYREMLLNNYTGHQPANRHLSEFLTLKWEGEKGVMTWKLIENKSHQVSLFEEDRLMFSEVDGVQWLSGRELLRSKAKLTQTRD